MIAARSSIARLRLGKESREPTSGRATYLKIEKKQLAKVIQIIERENLRENLSGNKIRRSLSLFLVKPTFFLLYFPDVTKTSFSLCSNRDLSISRA